MKMMMDGQPIVMDGQPIAMDSWLIAVECYVARLRGQLHIEAIVSPELPKCELPEELLGKVSAMTGLDCNLCLLEHLLLLSGTTVDTE